VSLARPAGIEPAT